MIGSFLLPTHSHDDHRKFFHDPCLNQNKKICYTVPQGPAWRKRVKLEYALLALIIDIILLKTLTCQQWVGFDDLKLNDKMNIYKVTQEIQSEILKAENVPTAISYKE